MRVVVVSDTHGLHAEALAVPPGDVFVHAGDFTDTGERDEVLAFNAFLGRLPHAYKLVVAGNHEATFDRDFYPRNWHHYGHRQQYDPDEVRALLTNALYLEDQAVLIDGFKFYGTPWQPEFCNWAFNLPRGQQLLDKWRRIPSDTDVLVSHTPPFGFGDSVGHMHVGCEDLLREIQERVKPTLHVFGHVHEGYGRSSDGTTTFVNASACTHDYSPINPAFVFDLDVPRSKKGTVSTISTPVCTDCDRDDDCGDCDKAIEYSRLLHEQLRVCSQKPPFVEQPAPLNGFIRVGNGSSSSSTDSSTDGKSSLSEFRVEGTAADLLFESTLKVRPVQHSQVRALRYLFSQGFRTNSSNYNGDLEADTTTEDKAQAVGASATGDKTDAGGHESSGAEEGENAGDRRRQRRRQLAVSRRVTVAVLNDLSESKEMTGPDREHLEQASIASESLIEEAASHNGTVEAVAPASTVRRRRDKTLRKRDGFVKLSTLVEETDATLSVTTTTSTAVVEAVAVVEAPSPPPAPTPAPVVDEDCVLCKYNVPGHVHPGREAPPPPVEVVVETTASSVVETVAVQKGKTSDGEAESTTESRSVTANKRLSSWF